MLTKHYYDAGEGAAREQLIATYRELVNKFLAGRVLAGSGLNIRFLQTVFEQCPALAWNLHEVVLKCFMAKSTGATETNDEGSRNNRQRLQAIELYQLLIKVAQKDKVAKELLAKNFALLGAVIGKVVQTADSWASKKVKKTGLCVGLYVKAARTLLASDTSGAEFEEDPKKTVEEAGLKLIKELELATEKDKTMSNLKGKIKEIKKLMQL